MARRAWIAPGLAIAGGIALLVATFLTWSSGLNIEGAYFSRADSAPGYASVFSTWGEGESAWTAYAGLDVALAACAVVAIVAGAIALRPGRRLARPAGLLAVLVTAGVGAWTLERAFDRPEMVGLGPGAVIGFAALAVALVGVALTLVSSAPARRPNSG
jgi:hypothetical protein